jgi:hypothetical protein
MFRPFNSICLKEFFFLSNKYLASYFEMPAGTHDFFLSEYPEFDEVHKFNETHPCQTSWQSGYLYKTWLMPSDILAQLIDPFSSNASFRTHQRFIFKEIS